MEAPHKIWLQSVKQFLRKKKKMKMLDLRDLDVLTEVSGVCLNITNQVIHLQIVLFFFFTSALISLLKVSNFDLSLLLLFFLRLHEFYFCCESSFLSQGTEEIDLLVFDGICLSAES